MYCDGVSGMVLDLAGRRLPVICWGVLSHSAQACPPTSGVSAWSGHCPTVGSFAGLGGMQRGWLPVQLSLSLVSRHSESQEHFQTGSVHLCSTFHFFSFSLYFCLSFF